MRLIFILLTSLFVISCDSKREVLIYVTNESNQFIDKIEISILNSKLELNKMPSGISMSDTVVVHKSNYEGAFSIRVFNNDSLINAGTFGYYSNFSDIKSTYHITILEGYQFKEN